MPKTVVLSWEEWEQLNDQYEQYGEIVRHASNYEISHRRGDEKQAVHHLERLRRAVQYLRGPQPRGFPVSPDKLYDDSHE